MDSHVCTAHDKSKFSTRIQHYKYFNYPYLETALHMKKKTTPSTHIQHFQLPFLTFIIFSLQILSRDFVTLPLLDGDFIPLPHATSITLSHFYLNAENYPVLLYPVWVICCKKASGMHIHPLKDWGNHWFVTLVIIGYMYPIWVV